MFSYASFPGAWERSRWNKGLREGRNKGTSNPPMGALPDEYEPENDRL
jgi:hypothetical protein